MEEIGDKDFDVVVKRLHSFEVAMLMNLNPRSAQEALVLIPSLGQDVVVPFPDPPLGSGPQIRKALKDEDIEKILLELRKHSMKLLSNA